MRYTNEHNFPGYVLQWLKDDTYDYNPDTISATTLKKPGKIFAYERLYPEQLEIDVSNRIASRFGTAIHDSFEAINGGEGIKGARQEERLHMAITEPMLKSVADDPNDYRLELDGEKSVMYFKGAPVPYIISGKFDCLKEVGKVNGVMHYKLVDFKTTSVWTKVFGSKDDDYIKQLSVYRYLANKQGIMVGSDAEICMIFTDWSSKQAKADTAKYSSEPNNPKRYPATRIFIKKLKLMGLKETEMFILENVKRLHEALVSDPDELVCSDEELWLAPSKWELYDPRRLAVVHTFTDKYKKKAEEDASANPHLELREIKGRARRCDYCACRPFCKQYQTMKEEGRVD